MRGENGGCRTDRKAEWGSSPHARGKPVVGFNPPLGFGLIPACAGKTTTVSAGLPRVRAHPRMRGENLIGLGFTHICEGSSPHARGKHRAISRPKPTVRLIPACAGKTWIKSAYEWVTRAHPRMRGENIKGMHNEHTEWGSSPHARGKPQRSGSPR